MATESPEFPTAPGLYWWRYKLSRMWVQLTIIADDGKLWVRETNGSEIHLPNWTGGVWFAGDEPPVVWRDDETGVPSGHGR